MGVRMRREGSLNEISDGKVYESEDLVKTSCNGCKGLASCCHGMGNSIVLDPYDMHRLRTNLEVSFEQLLADKIELNIVDGVILPNLRMTDSSEGCSFLNERGRCSIHSFRPGICRIFPLGRYYENGDFKFILQVNECQNNSTTMTKVSKWIDTPDYKKNKQFILKWHYFLNEVERQLQEISEEKLVKNINMYLLNSFYIQKYDSEQDFYLQFHKRLKEVREKLLQLG
jgi:Fe-S-cluster containining protein